MDFREKGKGEKGHILEDGRERERLERVYLVREMGKERKGPFLN